MKNKNFSNILTKVDGNTSKAAYNYMINRKNNSLIVEYNNDQNSMKKTFSSYQFPFNQTERRTDWLEGKQKYLESNVSKTKLNNKSLRKSLSGILDETNNYYNNDNKTVSKSIYIDDSNKLNICKGNDPYDQKYFKYTRSASVINLNKSMSDGNNLVNDYKRKLNYSRQYNQDYNNKSFSNVFPQNEPTVDIKSLKGTKKISLHNSRSRGTSISLFWNKNVEKVEEPKVINKFKGWITKDSQIFKPDDSKYLFGRKKTKSIDVSKYINNSYAGLKSKFINYHNDEIINRKNDSNVNKNDNSYFNQSNSKLGNFTRQQSKRLF